MIALAPLTEDLGVELLDQRADLVLAQLALVNLVRRKCWIATSTGTTAPGSSPPAAASGTASSVARGNRTTP